MKNFANGLKQSLIKGYLKEVVLIIFIHAWKYNNYSAKDSTQMV